MNRFIKYLFLAALMILPTAGEAMAAGGATALEGSFKLGPAILMIGTLLIFVTVGLMNRATDTSDYYAAGRSISRVGSGMAIASNWMSAASFLGMSAIMYDSGYHGMAYVIGFSGGYVLLLVLMASQIRRFGKYTAADFIGDRFYSTGLRATSAIMGILISFCYCVGQFGGIGLMFQWILGINYTWSVLIGASVVFFYTLVSGMLGVTKNMQIQYVIIIISFVIPEVILLYKFDYFWLMPAIGYGQVVTDIVNGIPAGTMTNVFGQPFAILSSPEFAMPWDPSAGKSFFEWMALTFSLMVGTAGMPHVISRFYVVPKANDARWSVVWGLFFIVLLYWFTPLYAAFGKIFASAPEVGKLASDAIVVYTSQLGDVNPIVTGFLAAGAVSAAFSTVSGLLVAGASAFSHDLYHKVINPNATAEQQMKMARLGTFLMASTVALVAMLKLGLIAQIVAVAFSMAGCTIFPLFFLGIWWSRSNKQGAIAGVVMGIAVTLVALVYFLTDKYGVALPGQDFVTYWLNAWYFAWIGMPLALLTNIVVSLSTPDTPLEIKKFLAVNVHGVKEA